MAGLTLTETQALAELADLMYSFLPGSGAIYTWREAAAAHGLERFWIGGSKLPAITQLLEATFEYNRGKFCELVLTAVREGMKYRIKKGNPIQRDEVEKLNAIVLKLSFKIPELHDPKFLASLPASKSAAPSETFSAASSFKASDADINKLHQQFLALFAQRNPQQRGFDFEEFLNEFFAVHQLAPRGSFRVVGEQIDGSLEWQGNTFLVEARWRNEPANAADMLVLRGKAEKSEWTRGLFISINGFSDLASPTLQIGRKANLIAMSGLDLSLILERHWTLHDAFRAKLRHTGETAEAYKPLSELK